MDYQGLFSAASSSGFDLQWRALGPLPQPRAGEVRVRVHATSVNPIDVKRAAGYGARMLRLKGAAGMPRVLGNDFAGVVDALGPNVSGWVPGQRVWGVQDTGPIGAHASHVVVPSNQLLQAPASASDASLAALPYTFCTLWRALRDARLDAHTAKGRRVLVHGASGGLGLLALQVLRRWGALATAACSTPAIASCLEAGASEAFDRSTHDLHDLPAAFDAVLNFAHWGDEHLLAEKLHARALGMASTTHLLLSSLDEYGWVRGLWNIAQAQRSVRRVIRQRSLHAVYRWTFFRPDLEALAALEALVREAAIALPVAVVCPATDAHAAFAHVARQQRGRAILTIPHS